MTPFLINFSSFEFSFTIVPPCQIRNPVSVKAASNKKALHKSVQRFSMSKAYPTVPVSAIIAETRIFLWQAGAFFSLRHSFFKTVVFLSCSFFFSLLSPSKSNQNLLLNGENICPDSLSQLFCDLGGGTGHREICNEFSAHKRISHLFVQNHSAECKCRDPPLISKHGQLWTG